MDYKQNHKMEFAFSVLELPYFYIVCVYIYKYLMFFLLTALKLV